MPSHSETMFKLIVGHTPEFTPMEKKELAFSHIESRLSPENLACDGERPVAEQELVYQELMEIWERLEARFGEKREPLC